MSQVLESDHDVATADDVEPDMRFASLYALIPAPRDPGAGEFTTASLYVLTSAGRSGGFQRGNLAVLIRYWTRGKGAARIRFGTPGDFDRCVRLLSEYVPPGQVKGFCARLHRRAVGSWPGPGRRKGH